MKREDLLALALLNYLEEDDAIAIQEMIDDDVNIEEICSYINGNVSPDVKSEIIDKMILVFAEVQNLISDSPRYLSIEQYPPSVRREMEYCEYIDQLDDNEKEYIKQFYHEYYNKGSTGLAKKERLLVTEDMIQDARRVNNSLYRDGFTYTKNRNMLEYIENDENADSESNVITWEMAFNLYGYEAALNCIVDNAVFELSNKKLTPVYTLIRFYIRMERLRKLNFRDSKNRKRRPRKKKRAKR